VYSTQQRLWSRRLTAFNCSGYPCTARQDFAHSSHLKKTELVTEVLSGIKSAGTITYLFAFPECLRGKISRGSFPISIKSLKWSIDSWCVGLSLVSNRQSNRSGFLRFKSLLVIFSRVCSPVWLELTPRSSALAFRNIWDQIVIFISIPCQSNVCSIGCQKQSTS